mmetsp:Transcript_153781/g.373406  ORF Transcript_153781/g.373406 Transcript_153781/m.373406 type:complete len:112 (-) Transcript_153781:597-932(-)
MPCPFCFTGTCKKHPKQDHGAGAKSIGVADPKATLNKMFDDIVGGQLEKLGAKARRDKGSIFDQEEAREKSHQRRRASSCTSPCTRQPSLPLPATLPYPARCAAPTPVAFV